VTPAGPVPDGPGGSDGVDRLSLVGVQPLTDDPDDSWQRAMRSLGTDQLRAARAANAARAVTETGSDHRYYLRRLVWLDLLITDRTHP
jgi:hypothetical protein